MNTHICQSAYMNCNGMRDFYNRAGMLPTSENADIALIRSHIAYHAGQDRAERAVIKPSRGHSYSVRTSALKGAYKIIVRITDYYDHRAGVHGYR
jgi:hypothetical protein